MRNRYRLIRERRVRETVACCGKKRAAERLAKGQSQLPTQLSPAPVPAPLPIARSVRPQPPAPVSVAMPFHPAPLSSRLLASAESPAATAAVATPAESQLEHLVDAEFQYTGSGRLTVTGPVTGKVYHFSSTTETIAVHGADTPSLISVPGLKIVS